MQRKVLDMFLVDPHWNLSLNHPPLLPDQNAEEVELLIVCFTLLRHVLESLIQTMTHRLGSILHLFQGRDILIFIGQVDMTEETSRGWFLEKVMKHITKLR